MVSSSEPTARTEPSRTDATETKQLAVQWVYPEESEPQLFSGARMALGRADECAIRLTGVGVSRQHAEIYRQGPIWVLRDCGSTNGTFLNASPVGHEALAEGQVVRIGPNVGLIVLARGESQNDLLQEVSPGFWIGSATRDAIAPALRAATSKIPITVAGETGTGKERVARAIHFRSGRTGPFVGVNCASIPETLAEAELFGHVKGSFTGATQTSQGYLRASTGGTLFLDEIAELSSSVQAKLLRAVQEQEVTPVGTQQPIAVDLRLVSASQKPLAEYVKAGTFREDLMMRLEALSVHLPPLRSRVTEIPRLFSLFIRRAAGSLPVPVAEAKLIEALCVARWPGNVRQLELIAQRLMALHEPGQPLLKKDLPEGLGLASDRMPPLSGLEDRGAFEVDRLVRAMGSSQGNLAEAARTAKISRQRAYRLLQVHAPHLLAGRQRAEGDGDDASK